MSEWIGIDGKYKRVLINMDKVTYIAGDEHEKVEIYFDDGSVKVFKADYARILKKLEKMNERE